MHDILKRKKERVIYSFTLTEVFLCVLLSAYKKDTLQLQITDARKRHNHARIQRGDRGSGPSPLKSRKNVGFLSNTGPDNLKNHKAAKQAFNVGPSSARQRNAT